MTERYPQFTGQVECPFCGHACPMRIVAHHIESRDNDLCCDWRLLVCPACKRVLVGAL
jgi:hypothetical protein